MLCDGGDGGSGVVQMLPLSRCRCCVGGSAGIGGACLAVLVLLLVSSCPLFLCHHEKIYCLLALCSTHGDYHIVSNITSKTVHSSCCFKFLSFVRGQKIAASNEHGTMQALQC